MYTPIYCRKPNGLIIYYFKHFDDGAGHTGIEKIALYYDKNKKEKEMTACIFWD